MDAAAPPGITFWLLLLFIWLVCHESHPGLVVVVIIIILLIVLIIGVAVGRWVSSHAFQCNVHHFLGLVLWADTST